MFWNGLTSESTTTCTLFEGRTANVGVTRRVARPTPSCSASIAYTCLNECGKRRPARICPWQCIWMLLHNVAAPITIANASSPWGRWPATETCWKGYVNVNMTRAWLAVLLGELMSPFFWDVDPRQGLKYPYLGHWTQRPRLYRSESVKSRII